MRREIELDPNAPTPDEIHRVRVWECTLQGHDMEILRAVGNDEPIGIICGRCGRSWNITPAKDTLRSVGSEAKKEDQTTDSGH